MREKDLRERMMPLPPIAPLPPGKRESDPDILEMRAREKEQFTLWAQRLLVEYVNMWRWCDRPGCRRARQCASPVVACYGPNAEPLRIHVAPLIKQHIADADAADAAAADPFARAPSPQGRKRARRGRRRA
jgi:hypothetical protein